MNEDTLTLDAVFARLREAESALTNIRELAFVAMCFSDDAVISAKWVEETARAALNKCQGAPE